MILITKPNDEELSAWLGELACDRYKPDSWSVEYFASLFNDVYWSDDWPDLSYKDV